MDKAQIRSLGQHRVAFVNAAHNVSTLGNRLACLQNVDYAIVAFYDAHRQVWSLSLRSESDEVDVRRVAEVYGGGACAEHPDVHQSTCVHGIVFVSLVLKVVMTYITPPAHSHTSHTAHSHHSLTSLTSGTHITHY